MCWSCPRYYYYYYGKLGLSFYVKTWGPNPKDILPSGPTPLPPQKLKIIFQKNNLSQTGVRTGDKQFQYVYTKPVAPVRESMKFASASADNRHKVM